MARGIADSPRSRWTYSPWVSKEQAFREKPFLPQTLRQTQKSSVLCVWGGLAAHFSGVRAISGLRLAAKQCPHLIKVHRDVTFAFKFTSCRMHYADDKRGVRGKKPARQGEKRVIEKRILRICKHLCNFFFFFHRQFPEEMSSFRVLSLFYISIGLRCFSSREIKLRAVNCLKKICILINVITLHNICRLKKYDNSNITFLWRISKPLNQHCKKCLYIYSI